jgi:ribosomal protein L33
MPYGKTLPYEFVCQGCNKKVYGKRLNKQRKSDVIKKYCPTERKIMDFKPKECKHSS